MSLTQAEAQAFVRKVFEANARGHATVEQMEVFHVPPGETYVLRGAIDCETAHIEGTLLQGGGCLYANHFVVGPGGQMGGATFTTGRAESRNDHGEPR